MSVEPLHDCNSVTLYILPVGLDFNLRRLCDEDVFREGLISDCESICLSRLSSLELADSSLSSISRSIIGAGALNFEVCRGFKLGRIGGRLSAAAASGGRPLDKACFDAREVMGIEARLFINLDNSSSCAAKSSLDGWPIGRSRSNPLEKCA